MVLPPTEHVQQLLSQSQETTNTCIQHYKAILRQIYDNVPIIPQVRKSVKDNVITASLTSNFLCLQCPVVMSHDDVVRHGDKKSHRFCKFVARRWCCASGFLKANLPKPVVDSKTGSLFCHMCDDFVWDPTLEDLRNRKIGTGTFSSMFRLLVHLSASDYKYSPSMLFFPPLSLAHVTANIRIQAVSESMMSCSLKRSRKIPKSSVPIQ